MDKRFTFYDTNIDKIDTGCVKDAYGDKTKKSQGFEPQDFWRCVGDSNP